MALVNSLEKNGNFLFRFRGQFPVVLFVLAIPVIYFTDAENYNSTFKCVMASLGIMLSIAGFAVRAYTIGTTPRGTSGRNTEKQVAESLNTSGIYSGVRHPLYLGNYLMWIGIVFYTFNIWFIIIVSLAYWIYYERIMFAEERFLEKKFGPSYLEWSNTVPAFWPAWSKISKPSVPFSMKSVLRREYSGMLATVIGFCFIEFIRIYFATGKVTLSRTSLIVLATAIIITLILRSLKHYTKLLSEEGRS